MKIIRPQNETQIIEVIWFALTKGLPVKAKGSGGSKNNCNHSTGICIDMRDFSRPIALCENQVTVQAGMNFCELNQFLWGHGLCLATICEWDKATVGGAVSTGSHGGSLYHGSISSSVLRIKLIDGKGEIVEISRDDPNFNDMLISFGRIGVILEVTLDCEKSFYLNMETTILCFDEFIDSYSYNCRSNEFYSAVWFPSNNQFIQFVGKRSSSSMRNFTKRTTRFNSRALVSEIFFNIVGNDNGWLDLIYKKRAYDRSYEILAPVKTSPNTVQMIRAILGQPIEIEFAIPYQATTEVLKKLKQYLHSANIYFPLGIRPGAGEKLLLSPCFEKESTWISLFFLPSIYDYSKLGRIFDLFCAYSGRPHWGKHFWLPNNYLEEQYPGWTSFKNLISIHDPDYIFQNNFSKRLNL
ncbi:MAG TPA: D-arabinono-1,4-lactone oxidase [Anaerolineales bacterium]|nr:D-arabinono-1,4-lactone oxidase [Anaerolineales bacterium]